MLRGTAFPSLPCEANWLYIHIYIYIIDIPGGLVVSFQQLKCWKQLAWPTMVRKKVSIGRMICSLYLLPIDALRIARSRTAFYKYVSPTLRHLIFDQWMHDEGML